MLEYGSMSEKREFANVLLEEDDQAFAALAMNKYGSRVVQLAMKTCMEEDQQMIADRVISIMEANPKFKRKQHGSFVRAAANGRGGGNKSLRIYDVPPLQTELTNCGSRMAALAHVP